MILKMKLVQAELKVDTMKMRVRFVLEVLKQIQT